MKRQEYIISDFSSAVIEKEHLAFSKCYIIPETDRDNIDTHFNDKDFDAGADIFLIPDIESFDKIMKSIGF